MCSDVQNKVGKLHIKMCSDARTRAPLRKSLRHNKYTLKFKLTYKALKYCNVDCKCNIVLTLLGVCSLSMRNIARQNNPMLSRLVGSHQLGILLLEQKCLKDICFENKRVK